MNDALAKFDQWKTATDKKHSDAVKSLEAQLAELRKQHTAKETENAKAFETLRKLHDKTKVEHQNILNNRDAKILELEGMIVDLRAQLNILSDVKLQLDV